MTEPAKPGFMDRLRTRFPWFNRIMVAQERYSESRGDFFAAGITYFTVFAMFPLIMVAFAVAGIVLSRSPELLAEIEVHVKSVLNGDLGKQVIELMDKAIASSTSVGLIGLATAAWAGLGWMSNLREALSAMWEQRPEPRNFVVTKISDLVALLSTFLALALTIALTALGSSSLMTKVLDWIGIPEFSGLSVILRVVSLVLSLLVSWLLFTWMIARLPRASVSFRSSVRAGLLAAVGFEIFKQVASIYLKSILTGPVGATFGSVLGIMVFAYITARLILFATAWAATSKDNVVEEPIAPPAPAEITTRLEVHEGLGVGGAVAAVAVGAFGALGLSRLFRR